MRTSVPARRASMAIVVLVLAVAVMLPVAPVTTTAGTGTLNLVGQVALPNPAVRNSDVWGWVDPNTNREYGVVGKWPSAPGTVFIIDATTPTSPVVVDTIPGVPSFDLKIWIAGPNVYLYLCDGNNTGGNDSQVWNVTDPMNPVQVGNFPTCHNIYIDSNGYMYLSYSTLRIYELYTDPETPTFVWSDGRAGGHDAYVDENTDRLYDFHGYEGTFIYDVSMLPAAPESLGALPDTAQIDYHHSGWTSSDGKYLWVNNELGDAATADITVWNVSNPAYPVQVSQFLDPNATVHNVFRVGEFVHASFYTAGYRVFGAVGPTLQLLCEYDTSPSFVGNYMFEGCWGVYPYQPSNNIYVSDMQNGFFVFTYDPPVMTGVPETAPRGFSLRQNYPNPFNPATTITYDLDMTTHVTLTVFDTAGRKVRTLVDQVQGVGPQSAQWHGLDAAGRRVASGVYFYRLEAAGRTETKRMILLK